MGDYCYLDALLSSGCSLSKRFGISLGEKWASIALMNCNIRLSFPLCAIIPRPMGRPSLVSPRGTVAIGYPNADVSYDRCYCQLNGRLTCSSSNVVDQGVHRICQKIEVLFYKKSINALVFSHVAGVKDCFFVKLFGRTVPRSPQQLALIRML